MNQPSFVRELFSGRLIDDAITPYPSLGTGRFRQLSDLFSRMRGYRGPFDEAHRVLEDLGLLGGEAADPSLGWFLPARARVVQELASLDPSAALSLIAHEALGRRSVERFGSDELRFALHGPGDASRVFGFALTEASPGSDVAQIQTFAEPIGDGSSYLLNGVKSWVTNARFAARFIIIARTVRPHASDKPKLTAFVVERGEGVDVLPVDAHVLPGAGVGELHLTDVVVPAGRIIGEVGKGFRVVMAALTEARLLIGAAVLGVCVQAVNDTIARLNHRRAFGRRVGQFPSVRERMSRMLSECYAAESLLYAVTHLASAKGEPDPVESGVVRLAAARCASRVLDAAGELHGAAAFATESGVVRKWADGRALCLLDGSDFALESYVALEGTRRERHRAERLAHAMAHPLRGLDVLGGAAVEKIRAGHALKRDIAPGPLHDMESRLADRTAEFGRAVREQLHRHGREIIEMQHVQRRIATAVTDLSAWVCLVARVRRELAAEGPTGAGRALDVARIWVQAADARVSRMLMELQRNDDQLRDRIATRAYQDGAYPFDVF